MAINILDSVKGIFTNDLVGKAASMLGENEGGIQKAISGAVPAALVGLLNKAGSGGDAANGIFNMAREAAGSGLLGNLSGLLTGGSSSSGLMNMAGNLFGERQGAITNLLSNFSGIKASSATSLLGMIVPAIMGFLGKYAGSNGLNAGGLLSFLNGQKENILSSVPQGLNLAGALGVGSLGDIGNKFSSSLRQTASTATRHVEETASKNKWLWPLLLGLVAVGAGIYLFKGCGGEKEIVDTQPIDTTAVAPAPVVTAVESFKVKLPDGTELDALKGGIEDRLVTFLNTNWKSLGADSLKNTWFDFDNINFEMGSAALTPESQKQVNNIATIIKAFPAAKFKVGGYTDKTGDAAANKKLSQERADAVTTAIKTAGASAAQLLKAEGYGSAFATVPAEAGDEERKKDRRISISVRS